MRAHLALMSTVVAQAQPGSPTRGRSAPAANSAPSAHPDLCAIWGRLRTGLNGLVARVGLVAWLVLGGGLSLWPAAAQAQVDRATAEELMKLSGLWEQLASTGRQIGPGLLAGLQQRGQSVSAAERQRLLKAADTAFAADGMRQQAQAVLTQHTAPNHLPALLAWYRAPLGQRISALEAASAGGDGDDTQASLEKARAAWQAATPVRQALVHRLAVATQAGEAMADATILSALAIQSGLAAATGQALPAEGPTLRQVLEAQRPGMVSAYGQLVPLLFAKAYAALDDNELAQYLDLVESPAGQHFNGVAIRALSAAMVQASHLLGQGLASAKDAANT